MMTTEDKLEYFEASGEHFIQVFAKKDPSRTVTARNIIRNEILKVRHDIQSTTETDIRPVGEHGWNRRNLGENPVTTRGRIRLWLTNVALAIGGSLFVSSGLVLLCRAMGV